MTRLLSHTEFVEAVVPCVRAALSELDPFGEPFTDALGSRILLDPASYTLDDGQLDAVIAAASTVGDAGFFEIQTELPGQRELIIGTPNPPRPAGYGVTYEVHLAWYFALQDVEPYRSDAREYEPLGETALVSATGQWAMLVSHENHAVVGGSPSFTAVIRSQFPPVTPETFWSAIVQVDQEVPPDEQVHLFLPHQRHKGVPVPWLPRHLTHLYGHQRALELLRRHGLDDEGTPVVSPPA